MTNGEFYAEILDLISMGMDWSNKYEEQKGRIPCVRERLKGLRQEVERRKTFRKYKRAARRAVQPLMPHRDDRMQLVDLSELDRLGMGRLLDRLNGERR